MIIFRFLRLLFTLYAFILFLISFFITIPAYFFIFTFFNPQLAPRYAHRVSRFWAHLLLKGFFIRCQIRNKELIHPDTVYVFVANHRSMLDIPLYAISCSNTFRFLAKGELTKIPLMGWVINKLYISVWRSDKTDRHRSMDAMKKSLDEKISVFLCPEGTRNKTNEPLLPFKDGAFRLAIHTQSPLAVLTVFNSEKLLSPLRPAELRPGKLFASWSQPISTFGLTEDDIPALKETVREMMLTELSDKQAVDV